MNGSMRRARVRRLVGLMGAAGVLAGVAPGQAFAATAPGAPTVGVSSAFLYPGVPVTFTFTATGGAPVAKFKYAVDLRGPHYVAAHNGTATVTLTPTGRVVDLTVESVGTDGTLSASTVSDNFTQDPNPAPDKDLNGDGVPDLVTLGGGTDSLASGFWQALGRGTTGALVTPAKNITGTDSPSGANSYFDGVEYAVGHFAFYGYQDIFVYKPGAGSGIVLPGSGDGSPLMQDGESEVGMPADPITGDLPSRITGGADAANSGTGLDGLFAISGDTTHGYALDFDAPGFVGFNPTQVSGQLTPDGTADWNAWTIATARTPDGVDMYLWNSTTGALYIWTNLTITLNNDGVTSSASYRQYLLSSNWNKGKALTTLEAADFGGAGAAGLWTVTPTGYASTYTVSAFNLTTHTATIKLVRTQKL